MWLTVGMRDLGESLFSFFFSLLSVFVRVDMADGDRVPVKHI